MGEQLVLEVANVVCSAGQVPARELHELLKEARVEVQLMGAANPDAEQAIEQGDESLACYAHCGLPRRGSPLVFVVAEHLRDLHSVELFLGDLPSRVLFQVDALVADFLKELHIEA